MSVSGNDSYIDNEYLDQSLVFRSDTVLGLRLDPPENRRPPRNKQSINFGPQAISIGDANSRN